jgi:hypothetical protein
VIIVIKDISTVPKLTEFAKKWNIDYGTGFGTVSRAEMRGFGRGVESVPKRGVFGTPEKGPI